MRKTLRTLLTVIGLLAFTWVLFAHAPRARAQQAQDWTEPVNLSLSGLAADPIMMMDFKGSLHVIWKDEKIRYKYSRSDDDGATWSYPQTVSLPFDVEGLPPTLLADNSGAIHMLWIGPDGALSYAQTTPADLVNESQWQTPRRLAGNVLNYDVILDSRGALHLAYIRRISTLGNPAGVFYMHTAPGGGGWSSAINLYKSEYFRSTSASEAFLRIAASDSSTVQSIYVTWDSRAQKRVFLASSSDGGLSWGAAQEFKGPQDTSGVGSPFNLNVAAAGERVLLVWQIGEPGSGKCSISSQWSMDGGETWGEIVAMTGGPTDCPETSRFLPRQEGFLVLSMVGQGDPALLAWNGERWSDPQPETRLPTVLNPLTLDAILFECRSDLLHQDRLYVVGCDQGGGGDAWFLSRGLESVENWFSPLGTWSAPVTIAGDSARITSLTSLADTTGMVHAVWAQSSTTKEGSPVNSIEYSRWDQGKWTRPEPVLSGFDSAPLQISMALNAPDKLLLSWVDGSSGELFFSWVNAGRANLASEWAVPIGLPTPSSLVTSPDMVVDASGRIMVVYAIPLNEGRGIYTVQSTDNGASWSLPVRVFDAVPVNWEKVDEPEIALDGNGGLHVVFERGSARGDRSLGLLYTHSVDGGATWSDPQMISEGDIQWSDILSYADSGVHVFWQEYDGLVFANLSQVSRDGGITWSPPQSITGVNDIATPVRVAGAGPGGIHFIQVLKSAPIAVQQEDLTLQDWTWDGSNWSFASDRSLTIRGQGTTYSVSAEIASGGVLMAAISAQYTDPENRAQEEIQALSRYLGEPSDAGAESGGLIPTPAALTAPTQAVNVQPTQTFDSSVLWDDNVPASSTRRNQVGIVIIGIVLAAAALILLRGRRGAAGK